MNSMLTMLLTVAGQDAGVPGVDSLSRSLERGGLYTVCAILMGVVAYLYVAKEKKEAMLHAEFQHLQETFQTKLLQLVEAQTAVMTKQALLTEKVEGLLARLVARDEMR